MDNAPKPAPPAKPASSRPWAIAAILIMTCCLIHLWIVTAGLKGWPVYTDYYGRLTDAFLHGQLNLRDGPPPKMLALSDPYDPYANAHYRLHDASLYNGKYYLYWGPAPALVAAAFCWIIRDVDPKFGDQYLVLIYMSGTTILATILIFQIRARFFPKQPPWSAAFAVLTLGLGTPVLYTLARSAIYEASLAAGQFFLMAGFLAAWFGVQNRRASLLALAGFCWAMSAGSRIALVPAIGIIALLTAWQLRGLGRRTALNIFALFLPLLAGAVLHAWYDYARFGSVTEFGLHYQLANVNQHALPASELSGARFIVPNAINYLLMPPYLIARFPYVIALRQATVEQAMHPWQVRAETVTGIVWSQPFFIFIFPALAVLWSGSNDPNQKLKRWLALSLLVGGVLGFGPALTIHDSTMRYLIDAVPCLAVLSAFGYWALIDWLASKPKLAREAGAAACVFTIWAVPMGLLMGFYGYYAHFPMFNPELYNAIRDWMPTIRW